jgi:hypothetical protein
MVADVVPQWCATYIGEQKVNRRCLMQESKVSTELMMQWVPVVDAQGRTHMEAVWVTAAARPLSHAA